jgi:hypothetical protein
VSLFVGLVVVSALAAAWLLAARRAVAPPRESSRVVLAVLVLATAAWPVASFLVGVPGTALSPAATIGATWVLALAIGGAAGRAGHRAADPVRSVVVVAATTVAVITVDLVTGGRLQATTVLGHSPLLASRFNGVGNAAYGTYAGAGLVLVALLATRGRDRSRNLVAAGALLAVLCVVDVAPTLGNDVGGVLSLVPIGILLLVALSGRRLRLVHLAAAAGALVIGLLTLVGVDALRAVDQRTHAGQLALAALDDRRRLWDTVDRKWAATVRSLGYTAWTRLLPAIAAVVAATFSSRRGRRVAGPASRYAPASLAMVALAVLGFLTNDAGSLVSPWPRCGCPR